MVLTQDALPYLRSDYELL